MPAPRQAPARPKAPPASPKRAPVGPLKHVATRSTSGVKAAVKVIAPARQPHQ